MALHDPITLPSRHAGINSFVTLLKADATLVAACNPGGIYLPHKVPADNPGNGQASWVNVVVWQLPSFTSPMWDTQTKVRLMCQTSTQRVSPDDEPELRLEIIHQQVLNLVAGQKPLATMVIGYSQVTDAESATFDEDGKDVTRSNVEYQFIIR